MSRASYKYSDGYCIECFAYLRWPKTAKTLSCRYCHSVMDLADYDVILNFCHFIATFGYLYPRIEQKNEAEGLYDVRYSLITDPILIWMSLAALGGIVGGLSYDVVKTIMRRILGGKKEIPIFSRGRTNLATKEIKIGVEKEMSLVMSDEEIDILFSYIHEYIDKCQQELTHDKTTLKLTRDEFIEILLTVQKTFGAPAETVNSEDLEKSWEEFKRYYNEGRKEDIIPLKTKALTIRKIGKKVRIDPA